MTKQQFLAQRYERHFLDDSKAIVDYCRQKYPKKAEDVIAYADKFCRHEFLFNTENDLEQLGTPVCYGPKIQWDYKPANDPEYIWQFNRHRLLSRSGRHISSAATRNTPNATRSF